MPNHAAHLIALATELEKEGQYNAAKLLRAAATSAITRESTSLAVPSDRDGLAEALDAVADASEEEPSSPLAAPLRAAASALRHRTVAPYDAAPDPHVCRICGLVRVAPFVDRCERCGRWPDTAEHIRPIYWARASSPPEAMALLSATPAVIRRLLSTGGPADISGPDGGWTAHQTLEHLHNAQAIFRGRIDQLIEGGEPKLASVMVWTMEGSEQDTVALFDAYTTLRDEVVDVLSTADPGVWWNTGSHEEFGRVTLAEQVSYFANHEPTHLAQLADALG